jgi:glucose/arabinose dehydrogenase
MILLFIAIGTVVFAASMYKRYILGIWPAIMPPIAASPIPSSLPSGKVSQNLTGMPLTLPAGFSISIFAKDLVDPRVMTYDPDGNLLVSVTSKGKVIALPDKNVDGAADSAVVVAEGLNRPHGLAFQCEGNAAVQICKLFIAESDQIAVYDYDREKMAAINKKKIADLSDGGEHFTRTLGFGPDGRLYVSIGSDCNVCQETDDKRAKIFSMNPDGSDFREFARGLRNTVFFTWHPVTNEMWGADMGRDFLGDDLPPDEINILKEGKNYGWPTCYGQNVHDTAFDTNTYIRNPCSLPFETPSYIDIPAHSAPLGLAFVPKDAELDKLGKNTTWPEEYWYNLFVAYHGSWNRSVPTGYKVVRYKLDRNGNLLGTEDFIAGWLKEGEGAYGRPAGIIVLPGGYMYISDDKAGVIYRVVYQK